MSTRMLLIPAEGDLRVVEVEDTEASTLAEEIGAEWIELLVYAGRSLNLVVDEEGLLRDKAPNWRAAGLSLFMGRPWAPIVGDALLCGFHGADLTEVPAEVLQVLAGLAVTV